MDLAKGFGGMMTKNKIYLHTSNIDATDILKGDVLFQAVWHYALLDHSKINPYEYGKIQTERCDYHILIGNMRQKGCPWCGSETEIKHKYVTDFGPIPFDVFFVRCMNCGSEGPKTNVPECLKNESFEIAKDLVQRRYEFRRPWDSDLKME